VTLRVVVLGGAGNFGARILRALQADQSIELISAGRHARPVEGAAGLRSEVLDFRSPDFAGRLAALRPGLVIHCVGPFQNQDYRVAQASLAAGAHYLDLADAREFVTGFTQALQHAAFVARRAALSGASTLPALSCAVVDALSVAFEQLERVEVSIAPGQRAQRGTATLEAVFSYLGRPVPRLRHGEWTQGWGWMDLRRIRFAFGTRWGALCDVPDLTLLPARYRTLREAQFHAALELGVQHFALWGLAALRRLGVPVPVERWAPQLNRIASWFDVFGGAYGGMRVSVVGVDAGGVRRRRTWQLTAPARNGPEIPTMPAILLARKIARGEPIATGAAPCVGYLTLAEFTPLFESWQIVTRVWEEPV
jgi:hypothetical protein